jgi:SAM-dependent methyltransferase
VGKLDNLSPGIERALLPPSGAACMQVQVLDRWLLENLVCPRDHGGLTVVGNGLTCAAGHEYPVVKGVPVMLVNDVEQTLWVGKASWESARGACQPFEAERKDDYFLDTIGVGDEERSGMTREIEKGQAGQVDPVVRYMVLATSGNLYKHLVGRLSAYPIPELRLPPQRGELLLDLGCGWGRWCVAASRKGYHPVGVDTSLGAVLAARRVSHQLGASASFVVADARNLPFRSALFDVVFSYSLLQHFSKDDAKTALSEVARVLKEEGTSLIQMANAAGLRSLQLQIRRRFREARGFQVRYWTLPELRSTFSQLIGPSSVSVDGYFGLGIQRSDVSMMGRGPRLVVYCSELLRKLSTTLHWMSYFGDSLYVQSIHRRAS